MEIVGLWVLFAVVAIEIFITYARVPAPELYYVADSGVGLAAQQVLLFIGFPVGLVAVLAAGVALDRLVPPRALVVTAGVAGLAGAALVGTGVDEVDADVRQVSVLALVGVALATALCATTARRGGVAPFRRLPGDRLRVVIAVAIGLISIPWMLADIGLAVDQVPGLNRVFISEAVRPDPGRAAPFSAVHDGHHHGMDGALLVWSALLASRLLPGLASIRMRGALGPYVALLLTFGTANALQDFWTEQVVKRGVTSTELPRFTTISPDPKWAVLLLMAGGAYRALLRPGAPLASARATGSGNDGRPVPS